jgi:hypothetical protein
LVACGGPGSDSVFTDKDAKAASDESAARKAAQARLAMAAPPKDVRTFQGYYRKFEEQSGFQPCGTSALLDVTGSAEGQRNLRERFRWSALYEGAKMFVVFRGAIVIDTPMVAGANGDSTRGAIRRRFYLVDVDSLRSWRIRDCNGMKVSNVIVP